MQNIQGYC